MKINPDHIRKASGKERVRIVHEPQSKKPWITVQGDPDRCKSCGTTEGIAWWKDFMIWICPLCKKGLLEGQLDPSVLSRPKKRPQPMDVGRTMARMKDIIPRGIENARWIVCTCGAEFRTAPFKPFDTHPPAFDQWVRHAMSTEMCWLGDWSDRSPGSSASSDQDTIKALKAQIADLLKKLGR